MGRQKVTDTARRWSVVGESRAGILNLFTLGFGFILFLGVIMILFCKEIKIKVDPNSN